ncbi:MAG TPA: gluconate:H+ symporter [Hanamia sp.]|nr:gluconate:H+ symporter [Hanamia sp.]
MNFIILLVGIILLLILIVYKMSPVLALLIASIFTGLLLGMPALKVMTSINDGIGNTLGGLIMVLSLGAMLGKLVEDNGVANKIVSILISSFKKKNIQWAVLLTGILVGIPLFYNAGFVVLVPLVFVIAAATKLPLLYIGIPMAAALSITHGFLPPHPGPMTLAIIFNANVGKTLLYGLALSLPIAVVAGIVFPRLIIKPKSNNQPVVLATNDDNKLPSGIKSFSIALLPVILIATGTIGSHLSTSSSLKTFYNFIQDPTLALLLSVFAAIFLLKLPMGKAMETCVQGVKSVAMIILIIAAGGAFKQILIDSGIGDEIAAQAKFLSLSPLFLGWLITALLRLAIGSATVAALTASGIVLPLIAVGVSPELMVLSVGAGSLFGSHVNDTGFWMFKEYFHLSLQQTFKTWTVMESLISLLGLAGVLLVNMLIH